ncbi:type II toxin-antitoxin system Phd/YefM family antitoxin [Phytomonospora endophytica]|uniref:Antitoxin n=1 Tax=Phytomonospora endophytica TaxID=714109 RepID=A0A841FMS6_9ACTN|nr:type II toxin-antitoxin system Phd/YefM family antitoxin [Phytomonospora endophytica]MBB6037154.1 prevent-host-death family protein [Phytomonospora endophytica]GIG71194.1 hypothetical protein Pen01_74890 [Phytomonospora endophytica]
MTAAPVPGDLPVTDLREHLAEVLEGIMRSGDRTYITRHGRRVAAIIPAGEAELLDELEDAYLARLAIAAKAESVASGEANIPLAELLAEFADDARGDT